MKKIRICLLVGGVAAVVAAGSAMAAGAPATVTVHIEGGTATLLPTTVLTTTTAAVGKDPAHQCTGTSALGALDDATHGNWNGSFSSSFNDYLVSTILGETPDPSFAFWSLDINGVPASTGACGVEMQTGDDLLFYNSCFGSGTPCYTGNPLVMTAPNTVAPGATFTVHVAAVATSFPPPTFDPVTTSAPAAGVTVTGGAAPATTNASGDATVTLGTAGPALLRVTNTTGDVPDEATVCATNGADGACGTTIPPPPPSPTPGGSSVVGGQSGAPDKMPPTATIASIAAGKTFAHGHGPRTLQGTADDPGSGIDHVSLRLIRTTHGHCSTFLPSKAKFSGIDCGSASNGNWFKVSTTAAWSYLLPFALPSGRYTLDVRVTDRSRNYSTALDSGKEHVAFTVG
jgi:hypothetical protein